METPPIKIWNCLVDGCCKPATDERLTTCWDATARSLSARSIGSAATTCAGIEPTVTECQPLGFLRGEILVCRSMGFCRSSRVRLDSLHACPLFSHQRRLYSF